METQKPKEIEGIQPGVDAQKARTLREYLTDQWYFKLIAQIESL